MRPAQHDRRAQHTDRERGDQAVSALLTWPVFLLVVVGMVQGGLWFHAKNLSHSAASAGYHAARMVNGTDGDGRQAADSVLAGAAGSVSVSRGAQVVSVTVTTTVPVVVPFLEGPPVTETVSGPAERWVDR